MTNIPLLQVALDYISLPPALVMASLVGPEVDVIEIGTPLCKAAGVDAISSVREICPDKIILADFKTPDVGGIEASMAFDAGADWITVIGGAATATVKEAFAETQRRGKEMLMELTGVRDIIARATEWRKIGIDRIVYHREWDAQSAGREWGEEDKSTIRQLIDMGYKVTITGGLTLDLLPYFGDLPASVIICGRSIREQPDPKAAAKEIKQAINDIWSGGIPGGVTEQKRSYLDQAAHAIRWGISELGMTLTIDGSDCPGCTSPQRFCQSTRTDIYFPSGVDQEKFMQSLISSVDPGERGAVGQNASDSFYIDVGAISQLSEQKVLSLLSAASIALNLVGQPGNTQAAMNAAQEILSS